jgi:hypothetical protein
MTHPSGRWTTGASYGGYDEREKPVDLHKRTHAIMTRGAFDAAKPSRRWLVAVVVGLSGLLGWTAVATASPTGGTEHFRLVNTSFNGPGSIVARGVFNAGGTDYPGGHNTDLASFANGAFSIHHRGTSTGRVNLKTCVLKLTGSGKFTLNHGFGAYSGLTGSGNYSFTAIGTFPRNPDGTCDTSGSVQPTTLQQTILANGSVSFR